LFLLIKDSFTTT